MVRRRLKPKPRTSVLARSTKPSPARAKLTARVHVCLFTDSERRTLLQLAERVSDLDKRTENNTRALRTLYESANFTQMRPQIGRKR